MVQSSPDDDIHNVIVRLGGFHLLMSFLGSIGYVMAGSGLKEALSCYYAPGTVDKMLDGHAYARAVRGHTLIWIVLCKKIIEEMNLSEVEYSNMKSLLQEFLDDNLTYKEVQDHNFFNILNGKFLEKIIEIEECGKTAKLWIQYIRMISIAKAFARSEKMGNIKIQLQVIQQMLP